MVTDQFGVRYDPTIVQELKCLVGIHDYGEPYVMKTAAIFSGERTEDGWDTEVENDPDPDRYVAQHCLRRGCMADRRRDDLDPTDVSD